MGVGGDEGVADQGLLTSVGVSLIGLVDGNFTFLIREAVCARHDLFEQS